MRVTEVTPFGKSDDEMEAGGGGRGGGRSAATEPERHTERKDSKACLFQVIASLSFVFRICQKSRRQLRADSHDLFATAPVTE